MAFEMVAVVGLGTMGADIAEVFTRAGLRVIGVEADAGALATGRGHVERSTQRAVDRGRLTDGERDSILGRITVTTSREDLREADLVVEAIPEVLDYKLSLFADLDRICKPETVLATNTSSLPVTAIAAAAGRQGRVIGMHFFNPAPVMRLVEVVSTMLTDPALVPEIAELATRRGRGFYGDEPHPREPGKSTVITFEVAVEGAGELTEPVACRDRAGFVTDALLYPSLNDAVRMYDTGYASIGDIDAAMRLGCGYPAGPFETLETIGLAVVRDGLRALYTEYREPAYAPAPLLDQLVTAGVHAFPRT